MFLRKHKSIRIAGRKIELIPLNAKKGLELIHEFSEIIEQVSPYVMLLSDPSRFKRGVVISKMLKEVKGLDDFIFKTVSIATDIDTDEIKNDATFKELVNAFIKIMEYNDLQKFWRAAYSMKIVEEKKYFSWLYSMVSKRIKAGI